MNGKEGNRPGAGCATCTHPAPGISSRSAAKLAPGGVAVRHARFGPRGRCVDPDRVVAALRQPCHHDRNPVALQSGFGRDDTSAFLADDVLPVFGAPLSEAQEPGVEGSPVTHALGAEDTEFLLHTGQVAGRSLAGHALLGVALHDEVATAIDLGQAKVAVDLNLDGARNTAFNTGAGAALDPTQGEVVPLGRDRTRRHRGRLLRLLCVVRLLDVVRRVGRGRCRRVRLRLVVAVEVATEREVRAQKGRPPDQRDEEQTTALESRPEAALVGLIRLLYHCIHLQG